MGIKKGYARIGRSSGLRSDSVTKPTIRIQCILFVSNRPAAFTCVCKNRYQSSLSTLAGGRKGSLATTRRAATVRRSAHRVVRARRRGVRRRGCRWSVGIGVGVPHWPLISARGQAGSKRGVFYRGCGSSSDSLGLLVADH